MDKTIAQEFLTKLYEQVPWDATEFIAIHDKESGKANKFSGNFSDLADELEYVNNNGYGIFFYVNPLEGGHKKEHVTGVTACWIDSDYGTFNTDDLAVKPHLHVSTWRGSHCYWRIRENDLGQWSQIQEALAAKFNTDPAMGNLNRVMRLPGSIYQKNDEGFIVQYDDVFDLGGAYRYVDLRDGFALAAPPQLGPAHAFASPPVGEISPPPAGGLGNHHNRDPVTKCRAYVMAIPGAIEGEHGDDHTYRVAAMGGDFGLTPDQFWPIFQEWNSTCRPPWGEKDLRAKLRHGYKYRSRPQGEKLQVAVPGSGGQLPKSRALPQDKSQNTTPPPEPDAAPPPDPRIIVRTATEALIRWETEGEQQFVPSFVPALNKATGGGYPIGAVTTILAYTGCYKSEFARQSVIAADKAGHGAYHVDVELGSNHLMERYMAQFSGVPPTRLRKPELRTHADVEAMRQAADKIRQMRWRLQCPSGGIPLHDLEACLIANLPPTRDGKAPLIVFDSAKRLANGIQELSQRDRVDRFFVWAEGIAKRLNAAVLLIHEQSRTATGGKPKIGALLTSGAESRSVEYTSSVLLGLYPDMEELDDDTLIAGEADEEKETEVNIIIGKNRPAAIRGRIRDQVIIQAPCWQHEIRAMRTDLGTRIMSAMTERTPYSLNAIHEMVKGKKSTVRSELKILAEAGLILEAKYDKRGYTYTKPRPPA